MSSNLRQRHNVALTGFSTQEREKLISSIRRLGGNYASDEGFRPNCTHVVCAKPSRSEKFLGACATGKWVINRKWITDSVKNGRWLNEDSYEWNPSVRCPPGVELPEGILAAPRKWRRTITSSGLQAFSDWKAAVAVSDAKKKAVYKRLLVYGGCRLVDLKVPFKTAEVVNSHVSYIFLDEGTRQHASNLFECGVLCLRPEFIGDFLVKSPSPDPMNYLIECAATNSQRSVTSSHVSPDISFSQSSISSTSTGTECSRQPTESSVGDCEVEMIEVSSSGSQQDTSGVDDNLKVPKRGLRLRPSRNSLQSSQESNSSLLSPCVESKPIKSFSGESQPKYAKRNNGKCAPKQQTLLQVLSQKPAAAGSSKTEKVSDPSNKPVGKSSSVVGASHAGTVEIIIIDDDNDMSSESRGIGGVRSTEVRTVGSKPVVMPRSKTGRNSPSPMARSSFSQASQNEVLSPRASQLLRSTLDKQAALSHSKAAELSEGNLLSVSTRTRSARSRESTPVHSRSPSPSVSSEDKVLGVKLVRLESTESPQSVKKLSLKASRSREATPARSRSSSPSVSSVDKTATVKLVRLKSSQSPQFVQKSVVGVGKSLAGDNVVPSTSSAIDDVTIQEQESMDTDPKTVMKRKLTNQAVFDALQVVKKKKLSEDRWIPTQIFSPRPAEESTEKDYLSIMSMTNVQCGLFETAIEECHHRSALETLVSALSPFRYPTARVIHETIQLLLMSTDASVSEEALGVLMRILHLHPPSSGAMRTVYIQSLLSPASADHTTGAEWVFLRRVIESCLGHSGEDTPCMEETGQSKPTDPVLLQHNAQSALKFIVAFLEQDYKSFTQRNNAKQQKGSLLFGNVLWPNRNQIGVVNRAVRDLLDYLTEAIHQSADHLTKFDCTDLIQSLVFLAFECICLSEGRVLNKRFSFGPKTALFLHEITNRLLGEFGDQPDHLMKAMKTMKSAKMVMRVSQLAMDTLDDCLAPEDEADELSLEKIVRHYFYLLPKLVGSSAMTTPKKKKTLPLASSGNSQNTSTPSQSFNSPFSQARRSLSNHASPNVSPLKFGKNINKRNAKGESLLHLACMKNNAVRVRELLSVPGIDVNIKDYAGWTPLHEACNHGNVECVKELLTFKPHRTITSFFGKDQGKCIDLLAANEEGITPLHDAVMNDRIEAARLLLNHGGEKLLKPRTILGYIPADLTESEEMRELLATKDFTSLASPHKKRLSLSFSSQSQSQESFSQGSNLSYNDSTLGPSDEAYDEILGSGSLRKITTSTDCYKYVLFVYHLLQSYLKVYHICCIYGHVLAPDFNKERNIEQMFELEQCCQSDDNNNALITKSNNPSVHLSDKADIFPRACPTQSSGTLRTRSGRCVQPTKFIDYVKNGKQREMKSKRGFKEIDSGASNSEMDCDTEDSQSQPASDVDERCPNSNPNPNPRVHQKEELDACQKDLAIYVELDRHISHFRRHLAMICNHDVGDDCKVVMVQMGLLVHDYCT